MNVTCLVGTDGAAVERYLYDPYGRFTVYTGAWGWRSAPAYDNSILYCGYYRDNETGLYHVRNRSYHILLGTWLQRDPAEYIDGMNLYQDRETNPIVRLDPSGLDPYCGGARTYEELIAGRRFTDAEYAAKLIHEKGLLTPEEELAFFAENLYILNGSPTVKSAMADATYLVLVPLQIRTMIHQHRRGSAYYNFYRGRGCSGAGSLVRSGFWTAGEYLLYTEVWEGVQGWEVDYRGEKHSPGGLDRAGRFCDAGGQALLIGVGVYELKAGAAVASGEAHSAADAVRLNKSLAVEQQMGEAGTRMAGQGTGRGFRGAARVAQEYGGDPQDWVKVTSSSHVAPDGVQFETHWVENIKTGQRVEWKTKITEGQ